MAFVATSAPQGWKLGRWSQVNTSTWKEEKLDDPKIAYQYQVVSGPSNAGTTTIRLKMKDQNTEVLLLDSSAQVFVAGSYCGEYGGQWEGGKGAVVPKAAPAAPARGASKQPEPAEPAKQPEKRGSIKGGAPDKGAEMEKTLAPEQVPEKKAPPKKAAAAPPTAPAGGGGGGGGAPPPVNYAPTRDEFKPFEMPTCSRPRKKEGLDTSDKSMQSLIAAAKDGNAAKVKELLDSGIDPDGPAKDGRTPLMAATSGGHTAVVETLLGACADPTLGKGEETPLTIAFQKGNQSLLKVLFSASFDNLNNTVGPSQIDLSNYDGVRSGEGVPDNAMYELTDITKKIASVNARERPVSPENKGKYGNYAASMTGTINMEEKDSDMLRTEAVRLKMKNLSTSQRSQ